MLAAAARLRPAFDSADGPARCPEPVELTAHDQGPVLVCLPTVLATSGPHQYARFAAALRDRRAVSRHRADRLRSTANRCPPTGRRDRGGHPPGAGGGRRTGRVLVGYSSGGLLATASPPASPAQAARPPRLVLIDTFLFGPELTTAGAALLRADVRPAG